MHRPGNPAYRICPPKTKSRLGDKTEQPINSQLSQSKARPDNIQDRFTAKMDYWDNTGPRQNSQTLMQHY